MKKIKLKDGVKHILDKSHLISELRGDMFYYAFDDAFGLLYIELKELSGAML